MGNPHKVTKEQLGLGNVENVLQVSLEEFNAYKKQASGATIGGIDLIVCDFWQQLQFIYALLGIEVCDGGYFFMESRMQALDGGLFGEYVEEDFDCGDFAVPVPVWALSDVDGGVY